MDFILIGVCGKVRSVLNHASLRGLGTCRPLKLYFVCYCRQFLDYLVYLAYGNIIEVLTKVGAATFSHVIIIILFIFSNPTSRLPRPPAPRARNGSTRKPHRREGEGVYFQVTLSFPQIFNSKILPASNLSWCPTPQGMLGVACFFYNGVW